MRQDIGFPQNENDEEKKYVSKRHVSPCHFHLIMTNELWSVYHLVIYEHAANRF